MGLFSVHPSSALVKFWQGVVEVSLRILCIVMSVLVFISAVATVRSLTTERTNNTDIESLRFDTRSPSGWLMLVNIVVLPLDISILIIRFLNFSIVIDHIKIVLGIDVVVKVAIALAYFCGGVPLAVHSGDWRFWMGRDSPLPSGDINGIVASTSAAAAFALLASFAYAGLAVWLVLFIIFNWDKNMTKYSPGFEVKVTRVGNPETSGVVEEELAEQLKEEVH